MDIFRNYGAKAIWPDSEEKRNRYVRFQSILTYSESKPVQFFIATDTKYELYINGSLAGFGQYEDFPSKKVYDTYDITSFLRNGDNLISILAYSQGEFSLQHYCGLPMAIFAAVSGGEALLVSDEMVCCNEDTEFISGEFERINAQRSFNYGFDLRKDNGWRTTDCRAMWKKCTVCDDGDVTYLPRPIPRLKLGEVVTGTVITQGVFTLCENPDYNISLQMQFAGLSYRDKADVFSFDEDGLKLLCENTYGVIDLGEEMAGHLVLEVEAEEGSELWLAIGEHLADLRVRTSNVGRNYGFGCICREGVQQLRFYIRRMAGRYLEFFAHKGIRNIRCLGLQRVEYPLVFESTFHSGDRLFNRIYEVSKTTLKLCMHEHYEDCPQREQALYGMDSRNQMLCGYYAFGETVMPKSSLSLLADSQGADGRFEMCAPSWFERVIPSFDLAWIFALSEYTLFSGDLAYASKMLPVAKKILNSFLSRMENGVIPRPNGERDWNFYEWTDHMDNWDNDSDVFADAPLNAFCMMALRAYRALAGWLSLTEEEHWSKECHEKLAEGFRRSFFVPEKSAYKNYITTSGKDTYSQLTQALALLSGAVPKELEESVREKILCEEFTETSLSYLMFKYDALLMDAETYGDFVLDDIERQWGYMLYHNATSFWETILGEADFQGAGSLCHGWSAVPIYIFWRYVMGIYPTKPGTLPEQANPSMAADLSVDAVLKTAGGIYRFQKQNGAVTKTIV